MRRGGAREEMRVGVAGLTSRSEPPGTATAKAVEAAGRPSRERALRPSAAAAALASPGRPLAGEIAEQLGPPLRHLIACARPSHVPLERLEVGRRDAPEEHEARALAERAAAAAPSAPLAPEEQARLASVQVHEGPAADAAVRAVGARAFAVPGHVVVGGQAPGPRTAGGRRLIAHELVHALAPGAAGHAVLRRDDGPQQDGDPVKSLDEKLYDGVRKGGDNGYREAAEALNAFSPDDIRLRLSGKPGAGRPVLTASQIASIHLAAVDDPKLGAESNGAKFTAPAFLDLNIKNEILRENWKGAAEFLNAFSVDDLRLRLRKLKILELKSLQLGALQNPRVGPDSAISRELPEAIKVATQATIDQAVTEGARTGDLKPPVTTAGKGPPGSLTSIDVGAVGNPNVGVAEADRELLPSDKDWSSDPKYLDNGISGTTYGLYTNEFQIQYADGSFVDLDIDQLKAGAKSGSAAGGYFRNRKDGRIYPTAFSRGALPTITASVDATLAKEPEARARALNAWIDLAIAAQGVAGATIRVGQALSRGAAARPATKQEPGEGAGTPAAKPRTPAGGQDVSAGGTTGEQSGAQGMSAAGKGGTPPPAGQGGTQGGMQQVTPGGVTRPPPAVEGIPPEAFDMKVPKFGQYFATQLAVGEVTVAGKAMGSGSLLSAAAGARVVGTTTTVAEGAVTVGATQMAKAVVVAGGRYVVDASAVTGRAVTAAIVIGQSVYLVLSPAPGTETPAQAPGRSDQSVTAPGKDKAPATLPGTGTGGPVTDPGENEPVEAPGPLVDDRAECAKLIGSKTTHDHHVFPQKFRERFKDLQIDVDDYTITLRWDRHVGTNGVHNALDWNPQWEDFFFDMPEVSKMTTEQARGWRLRALNFGFRLMVEAGIDRRRVHPFHK